MTDARTQTPRAVNEPVLQFAPGSAEREATLKAIEQLRQRTHELPMTINGERRMGDDTFKVLEPHETARAVGTASQATHRDATDAINAALKAAPPPTRRLCLRHHALQLHRDCRKLADRSSAHGQHGCVEASTDANAHCAFHYGVAGRSRFAGRCH